MLSEPIKEFILPDQTCQRLTLAQIQFATNNFDEALVIGRGGFGQVYKSLTNFGSSVNQVAIKRLHATSNQGSNEYEAEVKLLSKLRHANLVPLIGYCNQGNDMVLAYEFMPNGTLEDHLHRGVTFLSWLQRLKICVGAARGLHYLHTGSSTKHGVIHRDVKTSNILLDSEFDAKISDFGLAKVGTINQTRTHVSTLVKGTFGYMDPCYFYSGKLTRKSDVYAFGVVLFEVLSGRQAVDQTLDDDQWSLAVWAQDHFKEGRLNEIINHGLIGQISKKCLKEFASLAVLCLHDQAKQRPTMAEVIVKLESILSRERESAGSVAVAVDTRFFNKVKYMFTSKSEVMPTHAEGSKSNYPKSLLDLIPKEFNHANPGKFLDQLLFGDAGTTSLSWVARLKIAVGAAQGLSSFHKKGNPAYIQFKTSCILVDTDYNAWVWDTDYKEDCSSLMLPSFCSFQKDAHYAAPEWFHYLADEKIKGTNESHQCEKGFAVKNEIYSFGVVLLEILTGMKVFDRNRPQGKQNLVKWATPLLAHVENLGLIMDPRLQDDNNPPKGAFMLAELVSNCLQLTQDKRPSMEKILQSLLQCYIQLTPKKQTK